MKVIRNCNVIPMTEEKVLEGYDVWFDRDAIRYVVKNGSLNIPAEEEYNGTGKYLIPGLYDCHIHVSNPEDFKWYLAYGVTRVTCMMGNAKILDWREELASGKRIGPKMKTSSPIIDGTAKYLQPVMDYGRTKEHLPLEEEYADILAIDGIIEAKDEETARRAVRYSKKAGYDFIKLYNNLKREVYYAACDEAKKQGLMVAGHMMDCLNDDNCDNVIRPFRFEQKTIEHISGISETIRDEALRDGVAIGTTFAVEKVILGGYRDTEEYQEKYLSKVTEAEQKEWRACGMRRQAVYKQEPNRKPVKRRGMEYYQMIARTFRDAGGQLLIGTDSGIDGLLPGVDMHIELEMVKDCGFTNYEVLHMATVEAANFYWKGEATGTIEEGAPSELVLLDANPLEEIANTWKINAGILPSPAPIPSSSAMSWPD